MKEIFKYILKAVLIFLLYVSGFVSSIISGYIYTESPVDFYPILIIGGLCHAGGDFLIRSLAKEGQSGFCKGVKVFFTVYGCISIVMSVLMLLLWILGVQIPNV